MKLLVDGEPKITTSIANEEEDSNRNSSGRKSPKPHKPSNKEEIDLNTPDESGNKSKKWFSSRNSLDKSERKKEKGPLVKPSLLKTLRQVFQTSPKSSSSSSSSPGTLPSPSIDFSPQNNPRVSSFLRLSTTELSPALIVCRLCEDSVPADGLDDHTKECALRQELEMSVYKYNVSLKKLATLVSLRKNNFQIQNFHVDTLLIIFYLGF